MYSKSPAVWWHCDISTFLILPFIIQKKAARIFIQKYILSCSTEEKSHMGFGMTLEWKNNETCFLSEWDLITDCRGMFSFSDCPSLHLFSSRNSSHPQLIKSLTLWDLCRKDGVSQHTSFLYFIQRREEVMFYSCNVVAHVMLPSSVCTCVCVFGPQRNGQTVMGECILFITPRDPRNGRTLARKGGTQSHTTNNFIYFFIDVYLK